MLWQCGRLLWGWRTPWNKQEEPAAMEVRRLFCWMGFLILQSRILKNGCYSKYAVTSAKEDEK